MANTMVTGIKCLNCGYKLPEGQFFEGCKECQTEKLVSNLTVAYDYERLKNIVTKELFASRRHDLWRYKELLPVDPNFIVSIGEGGTPLIQCSKMAISLNILKLYIKDESRNPTWSFKDRLASVAISKACEFGASTIVIASTGNHGAATAAYAARAGLPCVVLTLESVPQTMKVLMQVYGAKVVACRTLKERWDLMSEGINKYGWYPTGNYVYPPTGSNYYGIEGYKTIAFEIAEDLGWEVPDVFIAPVAFADGLSGVWKGFKELVELGFVTRLPRMVAVERFGALANALGKGYNYVEEVPVQKSVALSIASPISTYQGLKALVDSGGTAVTVTDKEIMEMQLELGRQEGIYAEVSSVASLVGAEKLRDSDWIQPGERVVCMSTSSGLKDPNTTAANLPEVPVVGHCMDELSKVLKEVYDFNIVK